MNTDFNYQIGDGYSFERYVSADDVKQFAEVVGDLNPIHLDPAFAEGSFFKKRIVHGAFLGGLISKILGVDFPGQGTVYISQHSIFKRPVYVDSTVKVEVKITEVMTVERRLILETNVLNEMDKVCVTGSATVWIPE